MFDLCISQIATILAREIRISFFQLQNFHLFKVTPYFDGSDFEQIYWSLFADKRMHNELVVFAFGKDRL